MRKSIFTVLAGAAIAMATTAVAQQEVRSRGKHEHGHGTLDMAIEGNRVLIEFHAPGADIVGFEHHARTEEDKAAIGKAIRLLKTPLALFTMPADAACRVDKVLVSPAGDDMHEHAPEHADKHKNAHQGAHEKEHKDGHMEFHAEYALACERPEQIRRIAFPYFKLFPRSRELAVTVIDGRGQARHEVERDTPTVDLKRTP